MFSDTKTIYIDETVKMVGELQSIKNPSSTLVLMTNMLQEELRKIASDKPTESNTTPEGKKTKKKIYEMKFLDYYTLRYTKLRINGKETAWWLIVSFFGIGVRQDFAARNADMVAIFAKR